MSIKSMLKFKKRYFPKEYKKYEEASQEERLEIDIGRCQEKLDSLKQDLLELINKRSNREAITDAMGREIKK